jgi:hypothetical protein
MGGKIDSFPVYFSALGYHKGGFVHSLLLVIDPCQVLMSPLYFDLKCDVKSNLHGLCRGDPKDVSSRR